MANTKIPAGYQGTYAKTADGSPVLVMVAKSESIVDNKEKKTMSEENKKYVPYTTEQKKEYAKQFTPNEIKSYRKDSGAHTRIWGISAGAIPFLSTTI